MHPKRCVSVYTYLLHDGQNPTEEDCIYIYIYIYIYICMSHSTVKSAQCGIIISISEKHNIPLHEGKEAKNWCFSFLNCL